MTKTTFQDNSPAPEKALIVGASLRGHQRTENLVQSLNELELLSLTAGIEVTGRVTQIVHHIDPSTFIGSGKVKEIIDLLTETQAKVVIFDDELSPRHQRELSRQFGNQIKLLDRSALILDIFAQHASTREGALQVELAQYEYRLPRLTREWTHLSRQAGGGGARGGSGGVGLRGPGETQLEVDKREIGRRITKLKDDLNQVRRHRSLHRAQRRKSGIPVVAIVGYTNAGKSTLLNTLSEANVYVADQLFATLDPTTRRINLPSGREILLTDTVGFIQKLPTTLIAAFRATLEEIAEADMLLHIIDASDPNYESNFEAVEDTLAEIDVPRIPHLLVWNKSDVVADAELSNVAIKHYSGQVWVSAATGEGLGDLLEKIEKVLASQMQRVQFLLPFERGDVVSQLYQTANVLSQSASEKGLILEANVSQEVRDRYTSFEMKTTQKQEVSHEEN